MSFDKMGHSVYYIPAFPSLQQNEMSTKKNILQQSSALNKYTIHIICTTINQQDGKKPVTNHTKPNTST